MDGDQICLAPMSLAVTFSTFGFNVEKSFTKLFNKSIAPLNFLSTVDVGKEAPESAAEFNASWAAINTLLKSQWNSTAEVAERAPLFKLGERNYASFMGLGKILA